MIDAAKKLIDKYKSITIEQLKSLWEKESNDYPECNIDGSWILELITGFGDRSECLLCKHANKRCEHCIHIYNPNLEDERNYPCLEETYDKIEESKNPDSLYKAIQERIKYLEKLISYAEQQTNPYI